MRIWLVSTGEPLPTDPGKERLLRTGMLAKYLVSQGHEVVWWSSTVQHGQKRLRSNKDVVIALGPKFRIRLLHAITYQKNISIRRYLNHLGVAVKFRRLTAIEVRPDVILCSLPTLELSAAATRFGKERGIPVVIDVRDLWPDVFLDLGPSWAKPLIRAALYPFFKSASESCQRATAITGATTSFVDWGLENARRSKTKWDREFPFAYDEQPPDNQSLVKAEEYWNSLGIGTDPSVVRCCFFGTMSRHFDLETVIKAARYLLGQGKRIEFVLCGIGDRLDRFKELSKGLEGSVFFPGWIGAPEIWSLMRRSSVGIAPYFDTANFSNHLPNKVIEYFSAGLPVVCSLQGRIKRILADHQCGQSFETGNMEMLASILARLHDDEKLRSDMGRNALRLFSEKFRSSTVFGDLTAHLESIISAHKERGSSANDDAG